MEFKQRFLDSARLARNDSNCEGNMASFGQPQLLKFHTPTTAKYVGFEEQTPLANFPFAQFHQKLKDGTKTFESSLSHPTIARGGYFGPFVARNLRSNCRWKQQRLFEQARF